VPPLHGSSQRAEAGRFGQRPRVLQRVHRSSAESLDGFFPPLLSPLPEAGALDEERNSVRFLIAVRLYGRRRRGVGGKEWLSLDGKRRTWAGS
jgi:hypothetical protein